MMIILLSNWITQKQYEQLSIRPNEVELAHLNYLPKAHKPGTPLRPIVFELKHPAIKISKFLDELLRPLFDKISSNTTVTSRTEVIKQLHEWSKHNICQETLPGTMNVMDLYTMMPQIEGILSIRKIRFVVQNNYFSYNGKYDHQVRGGAMGSPVYSMHMKKNIPFEMLIRAIKYYSTFEAYLCECEKLRMALLLNKYPGEFLGTRNIGNLQRQLIRNKS
ncbi:unnamed protein product [Rotaria sp. Silwood1]|nr:unnamed protein product [Rotaria sp. Silwood1]